MAPTPQPVAAAVRSLSSLPARRTATALLSGTASGPGSFAAALGRAQGGASGRASLPAPSGEPRRLAAPPSATGLPARAATARPMTGSGSRPAASSGGLSTTGAGVRPSAGASSRPAAGAGSRLATGAASLAAMSATGLPATGILAGRSVVAPLAQRSAAPAPGRSQPVRTAGPAPSGSAGEQLYAPLVAAAARSAGVDPALVAAVAQAESGFNPRAQSRAGAKGLMQLMDGTARGLGVADSFDPRQNLEGGARYLAGLLRRFKGDVRLALAGYNAGPAAVERHGGIPPYAETQRYVPRVLSLYERYRGAGAFGASI